MSLPASIPDYPLSRSISLEDKAILDDIFKRLQPQMSECTFANIFLFRKTHDYRLAKIANILVIISRNSDGSEYAIIPEIRNNAEFSSRLIEDGLSIYTDFRIPDEHLRGNAEITSDRNSFDYVYSLDDLADLAGNRYHKKRNRISYFTSRHNYTVEKFNHSMCEDALELLLHWERAYSNSSGALPLSDYHAAIEAVRLFDCLELEGVAIYSDNKLAGFALGEMLNDNTAVCHFEKGDPFIEGVYQLLNREFATSFRTRAKWINREQDLGDEGLRQAKLSYHPSILIEKFRITAQL